MSEPHEPTPGTEPVGAEQGGADRIGGEVPGRGDAGAQPPAESEPAPSAAAGAAGAAETVPNAMHASESGMPAGPDGPGNPPPDQPTAAFAAAPPPPAGHYVFVPAGMTLRPSRNFGPGFGRFVRNRATQLVAAVVVGAVIGGGTVAIVDNVTHRDQPGPTVFRPGNPFDFGNRPGFRFNGPGNGPGT